MLFNSYMFIFVFLPITWLGFRLLSSSRMTKIAIFWLFLASSFFYSYWNPPLIILLCTSVTFNYLLSKLFIVRPSLKKLWLYMGLIGNLIPLVWFKYWCFLVKNVGSLIGGYAEVSQLALPLGISFFTFQQIAYIVDVYQGKSKPEEKFLYYALYIFFFPHLIAGPIVHHKKLIPQLKQMRIFGINYRNIAEGIALLAVGLFKKVCIADSLSPWVKIVFDGGGEYSFFSAWIGALAYTLQIYFDFSGYSDMAMGLAKFFNISFPENFHSPYKSCSIIEFWRRWHITLSRFLRDYLYIPLGGSRDGNVKKYRNIIITMLLGGLWHGAGWTFIAWGGLHGLMISMNHIWRGLCERFRIAVPTTVAWLVTFICIVISWVFFRAISIEQAFVMIHAMFDISSFSWIGFEKRKLIYLVGLIISCLVLPESWEWTKLRKERNSYYKLAICLILMLTSIFMISSTPSEFLYFQF